MRKVDYNLEEFASLAGLPRKKCRDNLVRICSEYGFQLTDFKVEKDNENSDFIFTPEIAAPLQIHLQGKCLESIHSHSRRESMCLSI